MGHEGLSVDVGGGKSVRIELAPGLQLAPAALHQVRHHSVLAHGLAVQAIRARGPADAQVGFAENLQVAVPSVETTEHVEAAETATRELNADFLTVMLEGRYTDAYLERTGADAPTFTDDELKTIASPLDFVGINVYRPHFYVQPSDDAAGYSAIPFNESHPKMKAAWHVFAPEVMYWAPRQVHSLWGAKSIFVTENGCAASDVISDDGKVYDTDRVMFLRACLDQLQRATSEGVPVHGYFQWSSQDNLEWIDGFGNRFGLIYVDFETLERTPKLSAEWFRQAARENAVV
jgi:beta-glucosidase